MEDKFISQSQSFLGFFRIFAESIKTIYRNRKLLLPILLVVFFSLCQLEFSQEYIQLPFLRNLMFELLQNQWILHNLNRKMDLIAYRGAFDDILEALFVKQLTLALSSIIKLFFCVAVVSSTYEAYTSTAFGMKGMFLKIRTSWKNALVTSFCLYLTYSGILIVYLVYNGIITILVPNSWSYLFFGAINLTIPVCYLYGTALWKVSMVISVLEEGFGGFKAIGRATKLMRGKKLQASLLLLPSVIASGYVHHMVYEISRYRLRRSTWLAIVIYLRNGSDCFLNLFMFVVYTVFYHQQKKSFDKKQVKSDYRPIASAEA